MKRKTILFIVAVVLVAGAVIAQNVANYTEQGGERTVIGGTFNLEDDAPIQIGGVASGDGDVNVKWNTTGTDQLAILPAADDTNIEVGNGTLNMDLRWYGSGVGNFIDFDASTDILSLTNIALSTTGSTTIGDDDFLNFGTDSDVTMEWNTGSSPDQFEIQALADDTNILIGGEDKFFDLRITASTVLNYVDVDASADIWTFENVTVRIGDDTYFEIGDGQDARFVSNGTDVFLGTNTANTVLNIGHVPGTGITSMDLNINGSSIGAATSMIWDASGDLFSVGESVTLGFGTAASEQMRMINDGTDMHILGDGTAVFNIGYQAGVDITTTYADIAIAGSTAGAATALTWDASGDLFSIGEGVTLGFGDAAAEQLRFVNDGADIFVLGDSTTVLSIGYQYGVDITSTYVDVAISGSTTGNSSTFSASGDTFTLAGIALVANDAVTLGDASADTITVNGNMTINNDIIMGSSATDDITVNGSFDGLRFQQTIVDLDDASTSTNWTVSDTVNWTVTVGTGNSRAGGNVIEIKNDTTVDDYLELDMGSVTDLTEVNYFGFWMRNTGGIIASDEMDVDLLSAASSVLVGCTGLQIPAMASVDDWTFVQFDISSCTLKDRFQFMRIAADTGITANTAWDIQSVLSFEYSNGNGPVNGEMVYFPVSSGTVTQGEIACFVEVNINPTAIGVQTAAANCTAPAGIAVTTSATNVLLQTTGSAIMEASAGIADNAQVQASAATTVDDSGNAADSFGWARETAADAGDFIEIRLQIH